MNEFFCLLGVCFVIWFFRAGRKIIKANNLKHEEELRKWYAEELEIDTYEDEEDRNDYDHYSDTVAKLRRDIARFKREAERHNKLMHLVWRRKRVAKAFLALNSFNRD